MPANLTPAYLAADARFRAARTTEEKLAALDEMYATIPKHKGTEKLQADIKRRASKLREKQKQSGKHTNESQAARESVGRIALIGPAESGKSSICECLASSGMMEYQDVMVQLLDTPSLSSEHLDGDTESLVNAADAVAVVLDLGEDLLLDQFEDIRAALSQSGIVLTGEQTPERDYPTGIETRPARVVAAKLDMPYASENLDALRDLCGDEFAIHAVSTRTGDGLDDLRTRLFELLGVIRIYNKAPGNPPDMDRPHALKEGSTLLDFAATLYKDLPKGLNYARAWRKNELDGSRIPHGQVLEDGDIIELHE